MKLPGTQTALLFASLLCCIAPQGYAQPQSIPNATATDAGNVSTSEEASEEAAQQAQSPIQILHIEQPVPLERIEEGQSARFSEQFAAAQSDSEESEAGVYADLTPQQQAYLQRLEDIGNFDQIVEDLEIQGGAWSLQIAEELNGLGDLLQAQGSYDRSIEIFDRAVHINRVNNGLFSPTQVPLIQKIVRAHMAMGQWQEADQRQQYAFYVQTRAYRIDDPRMIDVFARLARWNIATFYRGIDGDPGPRLFQTYMLYKTAAESVAAHFGTRDPRYVGLLRDTAGAADMLDRFALKGENIGTRINPDLRMVSEFAGRENGPRGRETGGELALQQIIDYYNDPNREASEENLLGRARALAELGDWYLMRERRQAAMRAYKDAYDQLAAAPDGEELLPRVFGEIVFLPAFSRFDAQRKEAVGVGPDTGARMGYVDMAFDVSEYGRLSNFEVLAVEPEDAVRADVQVISAIKSTLVRPRIIAGEATESRLERYRFSFWY
ncbi:MAG: hypothetical protein H7A05_07830 [Pseudomonadales bacterium]|nr:hypothetical protein [Pseudomonadales bacterium]MCP5344514.1 hypothetical protein [Pseudomonadales bacterium]